jgi:hypothetical protein
MPKHFEITRVETGADAVTQTDGEDRLEDFTDITVRIWDGFDWKKPDDANALFKKLQQAARLNDESGT